MWHLHKIRQWVPLLLCVAFALTALACGGAAPQDDATNATTADTAVTDKTKPEAVVTDKTKPEAVVTDKTKPEAEKKGLAEVVKSPYKGGVAAATVMPPPSSAKGPAGSVISATSDMAEMGMDPSLVNTSNVKPFTDEIYLYAIMQAPDGLLIGGAASDWGIDPNDPHRWIYNVREGVKFHDGSTMTPEDFQWTWWRNMFDPASEVNSSRGPKTKSIEVEGNTVVVTTVDPEPLQPLWWPSYEGSQTGAVLKMNQTVDQIRNNPISAGNFKFVERSRGEFVKLEAHADHYCCVPGFKELTILEIPEISTRLALLKTGGADLIEAVPSIKNDLAEAGFRTFSGVGATSSSMWFSLAHIPGNPFNDKRVREAINIAIDRQTIVDRLYAGEGGPTTSFLSGPGSFGFNAELEGYPYDPDRAKQLMKDAGYANGFKVRFMTYLYDADFPDMPTLSQAVLGYLQELGIDGTVQVMEWTAMKEEMVNQLHAACGGDTVWCIEDAANPQVAGQEPYTIFLRGNDTRYHAANQNRGYMTSEGRRPVIQDVRVAEGLNKVFAEFDLEKQRDLFEDYNRIVHEEYIQGLLIYANALFAVSDRIADWQPITGRTYPNNQWTLMPAQ